MKLTGQPEEDCHFVEAPIYDGERLVALYTCRYCSLSLPEAGLGVCVWTRDVLLQHLVGCEQMPMELKSEVSAVG
jgi:hypothetical protein